MKHLCEPYACQGLGQEGHVAMVPALMVPTAVTDPDRDIEMKIGLTPKESAELSTLDSS